MEGEAAILLGSNGPLLLATVERFIFVSANQDVRYLEHGFGTIEFLTACPDGEHFAFWSREDERFHLLKISGAELWSRRINTDRAAPHRICFSPSGDGVACIDDYDGSHRLSFY